MSTSYVDLKYHVIIRTRDSEPLIAEKNRGDLCRYIHGIVRNHSSRALQIGGTNDHLHMLLSLHSEKSVAEILRLVKTGSSKWMNKNNHSSAWFKWQPGYAAFTVSSEQVPRIRRFILNQEAFHRRVSLDHEYRQIVEEHGLDFEDSNTGLRRDTLAWLAFHLVFSTKQRMPLITRQRKDCVFRTLAELVTGHQGRLLEVGGMPDHVHLLTEIPCTVAVADFLQAIKSISSPQLSQEGQGSPFAWQRGYGAFSVSRSRMPVVAQYIRRQEEHHRGISFDDELRRLLDG